ncbi:hypothetical protein ACOMHN_064337 [Nucella lapillus]
MDQGTGDCTQGQSTPVTDDFVKLGPAWSVKEEPQDEPPAVYSTAQPMSDNTSGSLLSLNTTGHVCQRRHACQLCSAAFVLPGSLQVHMETFHGETLKPKLPVASRLQASAGEDTEKKLGPPWSVKEEPQDEPSAVYSTVQPMSDNTSGSLLLSLNTSHVCQRCSATFVLFSSLELHMVTFHGETLHDWFLMYSAYKSSSVGGCYHESETENVGDCKKKTEGKKKAVKEKKEKRHTKTDRENNYGGLMYHLFMKGDKLIHVGNRKKSLVCESCGKVFTTTSNLEAHKLIHSGDNPFKCDVCCKTFAQASNMKKHRVTHTGHKPFVCDVCSRGYKTVGSLKRHKLKHTG